MPDLPPGPRGPSLVQTLQLVREGPAFFEACAARYGDPFTLRVLGFGRMVVVSEPSAIAEIFSERIGDVRGGEASGSLLPVAGPASLALLDGQPHHRLRRLLTPPFHGERMRHYATAIADLARNELAPWRAGGVVSLYDKMAHLTLEVMLRAVFGVQGERARAFHDALGVLTRVWTPLLGLVAPLRADLGPWSPGGRLARALRGVDALIYEEIDRRRQDPSPRDDILSLLLATTDEDGKPLEARSLRDQLVTMLFAGHETTATALAWAGVWLSRTPRVLERLFEELREAGGTADPLRTASLPYLGAVCNETLRIASVVLMVVRRVHGTLPLGRYQVPDGALVAPCIHLTHRRPELYPDPETFRPERFLERKFSTSEFIPFGGGVRHCLGWSLALYEMKLVVAELVWQLRLEAADSGPVRTEAGAGTVRPHRGGLVRVAARERS
jgi:cytochrome P450